MTIALKASAARPATVIMSVSYFSFDDPTPSELAEAVEEVIGSYDASAQFLFGEEPCVRNEVSAISIAGDAIDMGHKDMDAVKSYARRCLSVAFVPNETHEEGRT